MHTELEMQVRDRNKETKLALYRHTKQMLQTDTAFAKCIQYIKQMRSSCLKTFLGLMPRQNLLGSSCHLSEQCLRKTNCPFINASLSLVQNADLAINLEFVCQKQQLAIARLIWRSLGTWQCPKGHCILYPPSWRDTV